MSNDAIEALRAFLGAWKAVSRTPSDRIYGVNGTWLTAGDLEAVIAAHEQAQSGNLSPNAPDEAQTPLSITDDSGLVKDLKRDLAKIQERDRPLPWVVQSGCSWRRVASEPTRQNPRTFPDGNVLQPIRQRSDGHLDLSMPETQLEALVRIVNNVPRILSAMQAQSNTHTKPDNAGTSSQPAKETQETMHDSALVDMLEDRKYEGECVITVHEANDIIQALRQQPASEMVAERNFVRMQAIAQRMGKALREIANGCDGRIETDSLPAIIAESALNNKDQTPPYATPHPDSALVEACESVRQALVQIGGRDFNCSPHQHGMAAAEKAQQALHKLEAALKAKGEQKEKG